MTTSIIEEQDSQLKIVKDLIDKGFTRELEKLIRLFVAPIYWYDIERKIGERVLHNGTIFFVDTGSKILGITAWHVFPEGFIHDFDNNHKIECAIGDKLFDPRDHFIDGDQKQDISTFSISNQLLGSLKRSAHAPPSWPPAPLQKGESPIICGYPGILRIEHDRLIEWAHWIGILWAEDPGLYHSSMLIDRKHIVDDPNLKTLPEGSSLGGCSGGPLFAMEYKPIWKWRVAGLISQGPDFVEGVYARAICNVNPDGSITRPVV